RVVTFPTVATPAPRAPRASARRRRLVPFAAIAAALLLLVAGLGIVLAPATSGLQARAQLTIFQGNAEYRRAGGAYVAASTGQVVRQGDSIRTTANTHAAVTFFDDSITVLEPATELEVVSLRALSSGDIDVTLRQTAGRT